MFWTGGLACKSLADGAVCTLGAAMTRCNVSIGNLRDCDVSRSWEEGTSVVI